MRRRFADACWHGKLDDGNIYRDGKSSDGSISGDGKFDDRCICRHGRLDAGTVQHRAV
jgi:hypothetical protein